MQLKTLALSALSIGSVLAQGSSSAASSAAASSAVSSAASSAASGASSAAASSAGSSVGSARPSGTPAPGAPAAPPAAGGPPSTGAPAPNGMVTVHVVRVGGNNGSLVYTPNNLRAAVGDMVQFQFGPANHTVTQSPFDNPCTPIGMQSNVTGIYSGFMPVAANSATVPTYTIMINNTTPMWLYCSQGRHCQNGMVMVINENSAANASRTLTAYTANAQRATVNLPGGVVASGTSGSVPGSGSGTPPAPGTPGASGTTSGAAASGTGNSAPKAVKPSDALSLAALVFAGIALLV